MSNAIKTTVVLCLVLTDFRISRAQQQTARESESHSNLVSQKQNAIPVHYVSGTHFEVGYSIGRTFKAMIKNLISNYKPPQKEMLMVYTKKTNRLMIYNQSLKAVQKYFPQYVYELKGMAKGAGVPFHELFLMALDDKLSLNMGIEPTDTEPVGCASYMINQRNARLLGHAEYASSETANNDNYYYILAAHVVPGELEKSGRFPAREEKFKALAYVGHLPGTVSGYNHHGLVFSVDTISVSEPLRGRIPREFITRALLAARANLTEITDVLYNKGVGTADGFNVNLAFLNKRRKSRVLHTIEVTPKVGESRSDVYVSNFKRGRNSFHTNRLLHLKYPELKEDAYKSSLIRESRYNKFTVKRTGKNKRDLLEILGNNNGGTDEDDDVKVSTINLSVFDFKKKTWTIWPNNPNTNRPLLQLPLTFTDLRSDIDTSKKKGLSASVFSTGFRKLTKSPRSTKH